MFYRRSKSTNSGAEVGVAYVGRKRETRAPCHLAKCKAVFSNIVSLPINENMPPSLIPCGPSPFLSTE